MGLPFALRGLALAAATTVLAGCATGFLLDNQVESFSQLQAVPAPATFRFDRTLSQRDDPAQELLEAYAAPALERAGLRRDDGGVRFAVQVSARSERVVSPYMDPWSPFGWGMGWRGRGVGIGFGGAFPLGDQFWIRREVSVIVRDVATGQAVYETRATNDGPWLDGRVVFPAMFEAALQGFPTPPSGARRVDIHVAPAS
jgi:hypothetical protein